jgi:Fe-S oxidoreductase
MARLKFAFEEEYYKSHPRKLRDYVFGYFHLTAGLAAAFAPLSNVMLEIPFVKTFVAKSLGITDRRPLPRFVKSRKSRLRSPQERKPDIHDRKKIIFLPDAFSRYAEPETEQAAFEILSTCGFEVQVLPVIGAGAALYSKGFIEAAQGHAKRLLETLDELDPDRIASIVGIEPPEIYFLKHDYLDLLPVIIRPADILGGRGTGLAATPEEFERVVANGLDASPISEVLIEQSIAGWKEYELEVMRDRADNCVVICSIENVDPMGVHTGDSITVAPAQTLSDVEYQQMRDAAFACIRRVGVETGGSNVDASQTDPHSRMEVSW